jgi:hypothetical protein
MEWYIYIVDGKLKSTYVALYHGSICNMSFEHFINTLIRYTVTTF